MVELKQYFKNAHVRTVVAVGLKYDSVVKNALTSSTNILLKFPFLIGNNFG